MKYPPKEEPVEGKGKKGKKGKKEKAKKPKGNKKSKGSTKGGKKGAKKQDLNARVVVETEPYTPGVDFSELKKSQVVLKHVGQFTLPAVDFTEGLLSAGGTTTTFHILDDMTVSIDRCKVTDNAMALSANVKINGNILSVHKT